MTVTPHTIQILVAQHWQLTRDDLVGRRRTKTVRRARLLAMGLSRMLTGQSFPEIGRAFLRDHTTVIEATKATRALLLDRDADAVETALYVRKNLRYPTALNERDETFIKTLIDAGKHPAKGDFMAIADIANPRDLHRLITALREVRAREQNLLPSVDELVPAIRKAVEQDGDIVDNLAKVFGDPIRRGFNLVKETLTEQHGAEYTDDLWARFLRKDRG